MDLASQFPAILSEICRTRDPGKQRVGCLVSCRLQCLEVSDSMGMEVRLALVVIASSPGRPQLVRATLKADFAAAYEEVHSVHCLGSWAHHRERLSSLPKWLYRGGWRPLTWALCALWPPCQCSRDHCVELRAHFPLTLCPEGVLALVQGGSHSVSE